MKNFAIERTDDPRWSDFISYLESLFGIRIRDSWRYLGVNQDGKLFLSDNKHSIPVITLDVFFRNLSQTEHTTQIRSNDLPKDLEDALNILGKYGIEIERKCKWIINGKEI